MDANNFDASKLEIKIAKNESMYDFNLCANDFIEFIDDFEDLFLNKKLFILTAYYEKILVGIVIAEDKTRKIDSIEKIIPTILLHLIYVNPNYRNKRIGRKLLLNFINIQKKENFGVIYAKLPLNHVIGINFLQKNEFIQRERKGSKIILELKLWSDLGIVDCHLIGYSLEDLFD